MGWRTATGSGVPDVREKSRIWRLRAEAPSQPVFCSQDREIDEKLGGGKGRVLDEGRKEGKRRELRTRVIGPDAEGFTIGGDGGGDSRRERGGGAEAEEGGGD